MVKSLRVSPPVCTLRHALANTHAHAHAHAHAYVQVHVHAHSHTYRHPHICNDIYIYV